MEKEGKEEENIDYKLDLCQYILFCTLLEVIQMFYVMQNMRMKLKQKGTCP